MTRRRAAKQIARRWIGETGFQDPEIVDVEKDGDSMWITVRVLVAALDIDMELEEEK